MAYRRNYSNVLLPGGIMAGGSQLAYIRKETKARRGTQGGRIYYQGPISRLWHDEERAALRQASISHKRELEQLYRLYPYEGGTLPGFQRRGRKVSFNPGRGRLNTVRTGEINRVQQPALVRPLITLTPSNIPVYTRHEAVLIPLSSDEYFQKISEYNRLVNLINKSTFPQEFLKTDFGKQLLNLRRQLIIGGKSYSPTSGDYDNYRVRFRKTQRTPRFSVSE